MRFGEDLPLSVLGLGWLVFWWVAGAARVTGVRLYCETHAGYVLCLVHILVMRDLALEMLE